MLFNLFSLAGNRKCWDSSWSHRRNDMRSDCSLQIQMLLAYSWMAFSVFPDATLPVLPHLPHKTIGDIQQTFGHDQSCINRVELWNCGAYVHPLERTLATSTVLLSIHFCPHGTDLHQVPAKLDNLGCSWSDSTLGLICSTCSLWTIEDFGRNSPREER